MFSNNTKRLANISSHLIFQSSKVKTVGSWDMESFDGGLMKIVMNRPKALNSLNLQMIRDLSLELQTINSSSVFWLQGAGGKAFCAGGDVKSLYDAKVLQNKPQEANTFFREQFTLDYRISQSKSIQIANWDGIVMGGGVGISAFSPFIIATQNTMYAMPQAKIGFFTDVGAGYFLSRMKNNIGYYLGMTGARLKGQQAYTAGLANFYIPRQKIPATFEELKNEIKASINPKETVHNVLSKYHVKPKSQKLQNQDQIKQIFSKPSVKQIYNHLKKSSDPFSQKLLKMMEQQCPFSVHIIFKSIQLSKNRTVKECFIQDYALSQHFVKNNDFFEGVRCVLVDKGDTPKWKHKHLLDVKDEQVEQFFKQMDPKTRLQI